LLTASLTAFTTPSCLYSIICYPFSFASHFCVFTKKACALPCYACITYCYNLYLKLFTFVTANKEKEEEEEEEEEEKEKEKE
jgi:hypothetical protein